MAKNENVSHIDRKGKPSGNDRENETIREAEAEAQENNDLDTSELEVQHPNRNLHKGEELKTFKDKEE
jgi:ribosomal protein L22